MIAGEPVAQSHFELMGGQAAVDRLVESFYRRMDTLPVAATIRALHPPDLSGSKAVLKKYLAEWLGGPSLYSQERGHRAAHAPPAVSHRRLRTRRVDALHARRDGGSGGLRAPARVAPESCSRPLTGCATVTTRSELQSWLLEHGFPLDDYEATIGNRTTPLMKASHLGNAAIVKMLIRGGANLDARNSDGNNALWLACVGVNLEVIDVLTGAGIDMTMQRQPGHVPDVCRFRAGTGACATAEGERDLR
jgi:hypothetical protein